MQAIHRLRGLGQPGTQRPRTPNVIPLLIAKWIVVFVAVHAFGGLVADAIVPAAARQHLWNPKWPPHAKFHNGQTMILGILCGSLALYLLFGTGPLTHQGFYLAAAAAFLYWLSLVLAAFFPGIAWHDPEFAAATPRPLGLNP